MYVKKLLKIGRSYYALIPSVLIQLLNIDPESDEIEMKIEGDKIIFEKRKK